MLVIHSVTYITISIPIGHEIYFSEPATRDQLIWLYHFKGALMCSHANTPVLLRFDDVEQSEVKNSSALLSFPLGAEDKWVLAALIIVVVEHRLKMLNNLTSMNTTVVIQPV